MAGSKLTKAQAKFLGELDIAAGCAKPGYDFDILRGSEVAMARRLSDAGLVQERFQLGRGPYWDITDAGRAALAAQQKGEDQ